MQDTRNLQDSEGYRILHNSKNIQDTAGYREYTGSTEYREYAGSKEYREHTGSTEYREYTRYCRIQRIYWILQDSKNI